jgi:putative endonuclease
MAAASNTRKSEPDPRRALGRRGEELAAEFLTRLGYRILETNLRTRRGEIDIIAEDPLEPALVFIEVKTRRSSRFGSPAEAVDASKQQRLVRLAQAWLQRHPDRADDPCRFDIVGVLLDGGGSPAIEHIKAAFDQS